MMWNSFPGINPKMNIPIEVIVINPFTNEKRKIISTFRSTGRFDGVCEGVDIVKQWRYV